MKRYSKSQYCDESLKLKRWTGFCIKVYNPIQFIFTAPRSPDQVLTHTARAKGSGQSNLFAVTRALRT